MRWFPIRQENLKKESNQIPAFAEEVAFYLSVLNLSREVVQTEKKEYFKKLYQNNSAEDQVPAKKIEDRRPVRKLVYYIAAAAVLAGIIFGTYTFTSTVSPQQLASRYEKDNLENLPVTMSGKSNNIQTGLSLYNNRKYAEALLQFESIIGSDSSNSTAITNAGISALKLKKYEEALNWFKKLETYKLYSNPALLYQALTLMDRNQPADEAQAKQLLQQIVQNDLDGKETAQDWLKRLK